MPIIKIEDYKPKGFPLKIKQVANPCAHLKGIELSPTEGVVRCNECDALLDPLWCLIEYAMEGGAIQQKMTEMDALIENKEMILSAWEFKIHLAKEELKSLGVFKE